MKILFLFFYTLLGITTLYSQDFSGLKGKDLKRVEDPSGNITALLAQVKGNLQTVTVTHDSENQLKFDIAYTGFDNAYIMVVVKDAARKEQSFISKEALSLEGKTSPLELTLTLSELAPKINLLESAYLEIKISSRKGTFPKLFLYELPKKWKAVTKTENLSVRVVLEPVGSAAVLTETTQELVLPQANPQFKTLAIKPETTRTAVVRPALTIRPQTERIPPGTQPKTDEPDKTPQGPDNSPISLWSDLAADVNFEFPYQISSIRMDVYPDKNPLSGIFYYLPDAYHLRWIPGEGYQFKMIYGTAEGGAAGSVRMTGTLTPGIGNAEVSLLKTLLEAYLKNDPKAIYKELRIIPLSANPTLSLTSGLKGNYNISADKISVGVQSTISAPIDISWVTDNRTKEEMQVALTEGIGIQGAMTLKPKSESLPEQLIPVRITLADVRTLGRFTLDPAKWRTQKWVNATPYPLKLKYIHVLVLDQKAGKTIPIIYSWSLGDKEVPSKAGVNFDARKMPEWLEKNSKTQRIWLDYAIAPCESCVNQVIDGLTSGTSGSKVRNVSFESIQVFEKFNASLLQVRIRSRQADPKGEALVELPPVRMEKDEETYSAGPLYLPEGGDLRYEYFFTLVTKDGTSYSSDGWKVSKEPNLFIGIKALKEAISAIPEE